jgi:hypothetical protein
MRDLAIGMSGSDVRALQEGLNTRSEGNAPPIAVDGVFGPETDKAVREFQKREQLDVDGVVGRQTRPAIFPLALVTATIFGQKANSGRGLMDRPSLKDRVTAGFSPGKLQLGGTPAPEYKPKTLTISDDTRKQMMDWATRPTGNVIDIPDDVRRQMMNPKFYPIKFSQLPKPLAAPYIPELTLPSSNPGAWKYDHCELQSGAQTIFPFTRSRQDSFVLTLQCITSKGSPEGKHVESTYGVQAGEPLNATAGSDAWTFNPFWQVTDVDRFGALGNFHWYQPYAQVGAAFGRDINPTITVNAVPFNLSFDATKFLTVALAGGMFMNFDTTTGRVLLGPMFTFSVNLKFGRPPLPLSPFDTYYHDLP